MTMAVLDVLTYPDPRLRVTARLVAEFNAELKQVVADMTETMYANEGCGLAATQVGINHSGNPKLTIGSPMHCHSIVSSSPNVCGVPCVTPAVLLSTIQNREGPLPPRLS